MTCDVGISRLAVAPKQIEQIGTRKKQRDVVGSLSEPILDLGQHSCGLPNAGSTRAVYATRPLQPSESFLFSERYLDASVRSSTTAPMRKNPSAAPIVRTSCSRDSPGSYPASN